MISVVIPVYDSVTIVGQTIDGVVAACAGQGWEYEVVLIDDGSRDGSRRVLEERALRYPQVRVLASGINAGQQATLLAGLRASAGDVVVCMDDDLQHPPEAIPLLVRTLDAGYDAVFARFARPRHATWRRAGTVLMRLIDRWVFGAPPGLTVTSFRAIRRDVVCRVCAYRGSAPYVRGQVLFSSRAPANVDVEHGRRPAGRSSYTAAALVAVVLRVLLEWSRLPAWAAIAAGSGLGAGAIGLRLAGPPTLRSVAVLPLLHGSALVALGVAGLFAHAQKRRVSTLEARRQAP